MFDARSSLLDDLAEQGVIDAFSIPSKLADLCAEDAAFVSSGGGVITLHREEDGAWWIVLCTADGHRRIFTPSYGHPSREHAARVLAANADVFGPLCRIRQ